MLELSQGKAKRQGVFYNRRLYLFDVLVYDVTFFAKLSKQMRHDISKWTHVLVPISLLNKANNEQDWSTLRVKFICTSMLNKLFYFN